MSTVYDLKFSLNSLTVCTHKCLRITTNYLAYVLLSSKQRIVYTNLVNHFGPEYKDDYEMSPHFEAKDRLQILHHR